VETATIGVLKEVFGVGNSSAVNADYVEEVAVRVLVEEEDIVDVAAVRAQEKEEIEPEDLNTSVVNPAGDDAETGSS